MTEEKARELAVNKVFTDFFFGGDIEGACRRRGIRLSSDRHIMEAALIENMTKEYMAQG